MRDFVCKVWCPSQCPHIVAFYITVQCLSEPSVALGTHSLLRRSRQHNAPYGAGGCHTSSLCFVFLCVFLGALLGSGTCVKGAPHVTRASRRRGAAVPQCDFGSRFFRIDTVSYELGRYLLGHGRNFETAQAYMFCIFTVLFTTDPQTCSNAFAPRRPSL